jgi:hypothetical protein
MPFNSYCLYGLKTDSEIKFPELERVKENNDKKDVTIRIGSVRKKGKNLDNKKFVRGRFPGLFDFEVENGSRVTVEPFDKSDISQIRTALLGTVVSVLLRQRNFLVLHACCISKQQKAFAFVGGSGWGKSTIAHLFAENGYNLLSEDVTAINVSPNGPQVVPGPSIVKLSPKSGKTMTRDFHELPKVYEASKKRYKKHKRKKDIRKVPLEGVYMLSKKIYKKIEKEKISKSELVVGLIENTRVSNIMDDKECLTENLEMCKSLSSQVTSGKIKRSRGLDKLEKILKIVESQL